MNEQASQTLEEKLQRFAESLTPEETAQLYRMQTDDVTGMLSMSLWDKAEAAFEQLTSEERAVLHRLLEEWGSAEGREADTAGHMVDLYGIYEPGKKGRPRPGEQPGSSNGGAVLAAVLNGPSRAAAYLQENQSSWVPGL
ncbi:MAG: hypothetical protein ACRDJE_04520 [Dehalococcoidia bacterium]